MHRRNVTFEKRYVCLSFLTCSFILVNIHLLSNKIGNQSSILGRNFAFVEQHSNISSSNVVNSVGDVKKSLDTTSSTLLSPASKISMPRLSTKMALRTNVTKKSKYQRVHDHVNVSTILGPSMSWFDFVKLPWNKHQNSVPINVVSATWPSLQANLCPNAIVEKLQKKRLSQDDISWCKWATSSSGGEAVVVGKSWGKLRLSTDRKKFDALNCNAVITSGINPSCDDAWGDDAVKKWCRIHTSIPSVPLLCSFSIRQAALLSRT